MPAYERECIIEAYTGPPKPSLMRQLDEPDTDLGTKAGNLASKNTTQSRQKTDSINHQGKFSDHRRTAIAGPQLGYRRYRGLFS